ncbi:DNA-3-methyladenine glycosylase [Arthrobacter sp. JZ12]|uniref:DNA-3-methyladenine glycosylase n=1 Tax=Arthrobacter sp. JZ12 TaxID=2654190 RepID=UPI002B4A38EC|nr:DNA-3-methyladenine glycosylase [Arthrobacter sp. JZ12]
MDSALQRSRIAHPAVEVAPLLLGAHLTHSDGGDPVTVRITEVEAYMGEVDPGSHAFRGQTARNATMFGEAGHLYVYFTYGMHYCANVVCGVPGKATGLLLRAGEITGGVETARRRRGNPRSDRDLARGPARLAQALGIDRALDGADVFAEPLRLELPDHPADPSHVLTGPRVGVSGPGGSTAYPWRYWLAGEPSVSTYRPAAKPRSVTKPQSHTSQSQTPQSQTSRTANQ